MGVMLVGCVRGSKTEGGSAIVDDDDEMQWLMAWDSAMRVWS